MPWKFDALVADLVFRLAPTDVSDPANFDFGNEITSDVNLDTGERTNDDSILDQGLRVFEVGGG